MTQQPLNEQQVAAFNRDGYLIVRDCVKTSDIARIRRIAERDTQLQADAKFNQNHEGEGLDTRLVAAACTRHARVLD